jgi:hypothetical protein
MVLDIDDLVVQSRQLSHRLDEDPGTAKGREAPSCRWRLERRGTVVMVNIANRLSARIQIRWPPSMQLTPPVEKRRQRTTRQERGPWSQMR